MGIDSIQRGPLLVGSNLEILDALRRFSILTIPHADLPPLIAIPEGRDLAPDAGIQT